MGAITYVVCICIIVSSVCSADFNIGENRHRWCQFKSCDSYKDRCGCNYGMGDGAFYKCAKRIITNWPKKLVVSYFIRFSDRSFLAMLL